MICEPFKFIEYNKTGIKIFNEGKVIERDNTLPD